MKTLITAISSAFLALHSASADTLTLENGASLTAPILRENSKAVILDLGYDVLRVPRAAVSTVEKTEKIQEDQSSPAKGTIYTATGSSTPKNVSDLVTYVAPATVQVQAPTSLGSGFIISPDGYVVTNNHVITGEYKISVILYEKGENELRKITFDNVELLAQSPLYDLALLKIHADRSFPYVKLDGRNALTQGQEVFAVGSPLGLERSVSKGIVSVRNRVTAPGITLIQHTSQINPGNSGGPLFNSSGNVVGVNNAKIASSAVEGIGFAIPIGILYHFLDNRDAYAFDPRNPNAGYRYLSPPGSQNDPPEAQPTHTP